MTSSGATDVVVVGSGPNGLVAALVAARAGLSVRVFEAEDVPGGGMRSAELIESGFVHDLCSAVHPMAVASPALDQLGVWDRVDYVTPHISFAHTVDASTIGFATRSVRDTAASLDAGSRWRWIFESLALDARKVARATLDAPLHAGVHSFDLARIGIRALTESLVIRDPLARAMIAGLAAHAVGSSDSLASKVIGITLGVHAHAQGWPFMRGGTGSLTTALVGMLAEYGVTIETSTRISSLRELPTARATLLTVSPRAFVDLAGSGLSASGARPYTRFRYGPGVTKLDATLDGPIPWTRRELAAAGTIHLGGSARELAHAEAEISRGRMPHRPFILLAQPTAVDATRAPAGKHVLYAYAHVPAGSSADLTDAIVDRIEEFAPGVRDLIRGSVCTPASRLAVHNANYIGGDVGAGATTLSQILGRPTMNAHPWVTPVPGVYLCSASTAPGPGVHGMAGWHAARLALRREFGLTP